MPVTQRLHQLSLIAAMFVGSVAMWLGSPVLWLWLAGRSSKVSASAMSALLMVLIGIPVTMIVIGKLLSRVDGRYATLFGSQPVTDQHAYARWLHTMRGGTAGEEPTMLEKVMVLSVGLALATVGLWYLFFSHGSAARSR